MTKIVSGILAVAFLLSLVGCSGRVTVREHRDRDHQEQRNRR